MAFCMECGHKLEEGVAFCSGCGQAVAPATTEGSAKAAAAVQVGGYDLPVGPAAQVDTGPVTAGYSSRIQQPEVKRFSNKMKISGLIFMAVLALIALIVIFFSAGEQLMLALLIWLVVVTLSAIMGFFSSLKNKQAWDGILEKKEIVMQRVRSNNDSRHVEHREVPTLFFRTADGKQKNIQLQPKSDLYLHYEVGDPVRKHPGFIYPEKYEKSGQIVCPYCGNLVNPDQEQCKRCKLLAFR